jgi:hypothetical protein
MNRLANRLPCPACQQLTTGEVLVAVSYITGRPHYRCFVCGYIWVVEENPSARPDIPPTQSRNPLREAARWPTQSVGARVNV